MGDRAEEEAERARCAADVVHFVDAWGWTYDPRLRTKTVPFDLFPRQREFLLWMKRREDAQEDGLADKSRDMGLTWLTVAYVVHGWLFRPGFSAGFGSRKLDLVDSLGAPGSVMEKCRILLDLLPGFLRPKGYRRDKHAGHCRIVNPENGATITGEGGDNIGRGDRKSLFVVDEAAFLPRPQLVDAALSQTTNVRIDVSTPNGIGNPFHTKRFSGALGPDGVFTMHWRDDPRKDEAWFAKVKARFDAVTIAQEFEIDYAASVEGIVIPATWVRAAVDLRVGGEPLRAVGRKVSGLDISEMGSAQTVFTPRQGPVVSPCVAWGRCNTTETAWKARDEARDRGVLTVCYESSGVGAGVRGTWDSSAEALPFKGMALATGSKPTRTKWPDGRSSIERFHNLRAELWWLARSRFERAYEFREQGIMHPPESMISIPNDPELIAQLSMPKAERTDVGKIKVESKQDMAKRGLKSPDRADSLVLSLHPHADREPSAWTFGEV